MRAGSVAKRERQAAVLEIIKAERVTSQEALRELLAGRGIEVTQATLSRDMRDLRLVKVPTGSGNGGSHYTLPDDWENTPPFETLLPTLFISAEGTGNLLVVKTMHGGAQAVASAIDWEEWPEVLGTIAGDDTILIIARNEDRLPGLIERIETIAGVRG